MIVQRLKVPVSGVYAVAERYYSILSAINSLQLTQRDIQLMAFIAVKGGMDISSKEEFCREYDTTGPTVNNIVYKLKKIGVLVKNNGVVKVNPVIALNFNDEIRLEIKMYGQVQSAERSNS